MSSDKSWKQNMRMIELYLAVAKERFGMSQSIMQIPLRFPFSTVSSSHSSVSQVFVQKDLYLSCITTHLKSCCCGYIITFAMKLTPATFENLHLPKSA